MKIKFVQRPTGGRHHKIGDEVDFVGLVEEGYAQKYIDRGWAVEVAPKPAAASQVDAEGGKDDAAKPKIEEPKKPFSYRK